VEGLSLTGVNVAVLTTWNRGFVCLRVLAGVGCDEVGGICLWVLSEW
jgi:hypothetical protein